MTEAFTRFVTTEPWVRAARCAKLELPSRLFFPERGESISLAVQCCARCSVRRECLDYALRTNEKFGIWGGTSERERRRMRRQRGAA